ncbi:hypothetical protein BKI52_29575 [marine bacterium AO1-C]|nr:hypothetical protein BKI52_29575 [marine bacterium AO1-C]
MTQQPMKHFKIFLILALFPVFNATCQDNKSSNIALLSNQIPTDTPLVFAKGVISIDNHVMGSITFNPAMDELFFQRRASDESHNIYTMKLINGQWSKPVFAPFSTNKKYLDFHIRFHPKGDRLYFGSTRPLNATAKPSGLHQWYIKKTANGWGTPIPLLDTPFAGRFAMCTTPAANGNLYFTSKEKGQKLKDEGIYYAINKGGHYTSAKKMGKAINYPGTWIAHPYVAPDESYIIYDAERTSEYENGDLYISFNQNGTWSKSYSLGPKINTKLSEGAATVSPDGKYLFFSRGSEKVRKDGSKYWTGSLYWVDFVRLKKEILKKHKDN